VLEVVLDYETRSKADLQKVGAIEYAKHPSTSIFCLGYKIGDRPKRLWIPERAPMPSDLFECFLDGVLVAHNAAFERAVTKYTLPRYLDRAEHRAIMRAASAPHRWRCLAAKAAMCSLPRSLEKACAAIGSKTLKDMKGSKLIKKYSKPRKPSKNNPALWWSDKKDLRKIYKYCLTDVQAEYELHQAIPDLSDFEQSVWELDQKINDRGVRIDIPTVKKILTLVHEETAEITRFTKALSRGKVEGPTKREQVLKWVNKRGANLANLQSATIRDRLLDEDLDPDARRMLIYRQNGSKTSTAKYFSMLSAVGEDHRARELLLYCGTIPTARWSGKRVQPQNFPRPTVKEPGKDYFDSDRAIRIALKYGRKGIAKRYGRERVMDVLVSIIRGMIIASEGHDLYCADFAAVEARIAFWVAGHKEGIRAFLENRKLYEEMASEAFGMPLEEVTKNSIERFVGKESVLGCQYGLGWMKFLKNCHMKGVKQVTPDMAKKAVYTYRKIHHPIPTFWKNIEEAAIKAILNPGKRYRVTKVVVYKKDKWLNIRLPSGRRLRYFNPSLVQKQLANGRMVPEIRYWTVDFHQWARVSIWGGQFTNHIVQGIARDLMVNGIINIENAGYKFLISIHDEGLSENRKGTGSVKEYSGLMTRLPAWAKGAPITAEGWTGPRYKKG
jgi:DNA polymerase